jgi:hypothetical protein
MRRLILFLMLLAISGRVSTNGQKADWNLRGGLNLMKSHSDGQDLSYLYHAGLQAGIRLPRIGFYGEAVYSLLENQNGGDPVQYIIPSALVKGFFYRFIFVELGGSLMTKLSDNRNGNVNTETNPDGDIYLMGGIGLHLKKFELSMRSTVKQSFGLIQVTAAFRF